MAKTTPIVRGNRLSYQQDGQEQVLLVETHAWYAWLEAASSFAFTSQAGTFTARRERAGNQRGGWYWKAYRTRQGKLTSLYLGKSETLTLARLQATARALAAPRIEASYSDVIHTAPLSASSAARATHTPSSNPLLATKLHLPRPRAQLVTRTRLVERLQQGVAGPLTLVSAPAGFGKTTLLAQGVAASRMPVTWLSLEAEDNDPTRFLSYLIAALQTLNVQIGATALALLHTPQPPRPETVLAQLANDLLDRGGGDFALVLDDYHVITAESIQRGMIFLLEHLPPQMHLVLATRADPPLPLARLRAQGQLAEVRTADLRFDTEEVTAFLQAVMGLDLPPGAVAVLESRTEGWIAGLQLAALSLLGRSDAEAFLTAFSGSHRYVLDYLSEEVLARQPEPVQRFLLHTSILERLSGPLCDAVREQEGSQALLEALERANLFVVALDDERGWYRYHHLFAEMLRSHLQQREPAFVPQLHRRASAWYEQHELPAEAVQHALAVPDYELAAHLIEPIALPIALHGQIDTALGWLNALPQALVRTRPLLWVYYAVLLALTDQLEAAEARLQEAERRFQEEIADEQEQIILGWMLTARAALAHLFGDIPQAVSLAQQALQLFPEAEVIPRAANMAIAIRAYLVSGDVSAASEHKVAAAAAFIRTSGNLFSVVSSLSLLARLHILQGRLHQAASTFAQVVEMIPRLEVLQTMFTGLLYYFGLGDLLRECNDLVAAEKHLLQGMPLIKETLTVEPWVAVLGYTALARLHQARGNTHEALAILGTLTQVAEQRRFPRHLLTQVAAVRAALELSQGSLSAAIHWAEASGLSTEDDDLGYLREVEYLTLVRVRIAQARDDQATPVLQDVLHLLHRLQRSAEACFRLGSVLEILVLRALAQEARGDRTSALSTLERALVRASSEGYIRLFVDEGAPMLALLREIHGRSRVPGYVETLLSVFGEQHLSEHPPASARPDQLVEPLTGREREVLLLLLAGASNREIARHLVVSVNTVKRHVYNLCGKLGVQSRMQAIARARTLHLL
jgi:LuxR family maltose regulon positive regulatory protein